MHHYYLTLSPSTWNLIFLITRYVLVALVLAYLTNVFIKRKNTITDIKGRALEWQVNTYKNIHRWVMNFKSVIAPPAQDQDYYSSVLSHTKFKIGYQGMEYVSFFDTPERLLKFNIKYNQMLNKDESFVDSALKQKLDDFHEWLDNVILFYSAFVLAESDSKWGYDRKTIEKHCLLTCKMFGIALQDDVNNYYEQFNSLLRDRIRNVKIAGVYSDSKRLWNRKKAKPYYEKSQMHKHNGDLMTIFVLVHFEEMFVKNPAIMKNPEQLMTLMKDFSDCYVKYLNQ